MFLAVQRIPQAEKAAPVFEIVFYGLPEGVRRLSDGPLHVGVPASFELAVKLARPGGRIANIGVHGEAATLHLEEQWARDITITTGLVDTSSTPTLMRLITTGQLDASRFITHHFDLDDIEEAYDVFARAADTKALKVVLTRGE